MDLSNYLLMRTRERLLLENKVLAPAGVMKSGKHNTISKSSNETGLKECRKDLLKGLSFLQRIFYTCKGTEDFPVAFATNALYIMERNGGGNTEDYEKILFPILRKKIDYMHAEGIAQTVWGLSNAGIYDKEIWNGLKKHISEKKLNHTYVKN